MSSGGPYDIEIHLTATDGVSGVLAGIAKSVLGLSGSVWPASEGFQCSSPWRSGSCQRRCWT